MLMWWSCPFYRGHLGGGNIVTPDKFEVLGNWEEAHTLQQSFLKTFSKKENKTNHNPVENTYCAFCFIMLSSSELKEDV